MGKLKPVYKLYEKLGKDHKDIVNKTKQWYHTLNEASNKNDISLGRLKPSMSIFMLGKFYKFKYKPETKQDLLYYDRTPLMFYLGENENGLHMGININLLPIKFRKNFVDIIYTKFYNQIKRESFRRPYFAKKQSQLKVTYELLDKLFKINYYKFAVRTYYQSNMKGIRYFPYENMYRLPYLEEFNFMKKKVGFIYKLFKIYFRKMQQEKNK